MSHETAVLSTHIFDQSENNEINCSSNALVEKTLITTTTSLKIKELRRILPTPICKNSMIHMRHERKCHVLKGIIGKCSVCDKKFKTCKLLLNAIKLWDEQCNASICQPFFAKYIIFPLSGKQDICFEFF